MQEWQNCPKEIVGNDDSPQYMQTRSYSNNDNIYVSTMHKLANWWLAISCSGLYTRGSVGFLGYVAITTITSRIE